MNKVKLEIIKINEDVIATSASQHIGQSHYIYNKGGINFETNHIKFSNGSATFYKDKNQNGKLEIAYGSTISLPTFSGLSAFSNINNLNAWYYYDNVTQKFKECADQSDEAHPIE